LKHCCVTGRRNHGRPLKRLLDTWDRNGSTSGPTAWEIDYYYYYLLTYLLQLSFNSVTVVLTPVQTKQIKINIL
jgi:hypothetical protein